MGREIKFRAWDKFDKEYSHDVEIALTLEGELYAVWAYHPQKITSNRYVIEQYTGLKDKNGKKIYEGDIVKFKDTFKNWNIGTIVYNEEDAMFRVEYAPEWDYVSRFSLEVIGNIHENPELLGGEE